MLQRISYSESSNSYKLHSVDESYIIMKNIFCVSEIIYLTTHLGHLQRVQKS